MKFSVSLAAGWGVTERDGGGLWWLSPSRAVLTHPNGWQGGIPHLEDSPATVLGTNSVQSGQAGSPQSSPRGIHTSPSAGGRGHPYTKKHPEYNFFEFRKGTHHLNSDFTPTPKAALGTATGACQARGHLPTTHIPSLALQTHEISHVKPCPSHTPAKISVGPAERED